MSDEVLTYPLLYFSIDNFDEAFEDVVVAPGRNVCVELVAKIGEVSTTIFSGAVNHSQLAASYNARLSGGKKAPRGSPSDKQRSLQFLNMRGPRGIGNAEMAVGMAGVESNSGGGDTKQSGRSTGWLGKAFSMVMDLNAGGSDGRGAAETDLNAFLTYVNLSWESIVSNVLKPAPPALGEEELKSDGPDRLI